MNMHKLRAVCSLMLTALCLASVATFQAAGSAIPMRGFRNDLDSTADKFVSLDLNGDGKADMLYYRPGGGFAGAYLSHGDGTFRYVPYVSNGTPTGGFTGDLQAANDTLVPLDLDGDGKSDFLEYRPGSGYTIRCLSKGDGTVACDYLSTPGAPYFGFQDRMTNSNTRIVALPRRNGPAEFIVYTPGGGSAQLYIAQPGSTTLQEVNLTTNSSPNTATGWLETMTASNTNIVSLDANGDGLPDVLVYAPQSGTVNLYLNNGNNGFTASQLAIPGRNLNGFTGNSQDNNAHAIALDLNGDGRQDLLWWQAGNRTVTGFLSNGDGTVTAVPYQNGGSTVNGFVDNDSSRADTAVALDLNGDGKQDFLWYSPGNGTFTGYLSSATGALTPIYVRANGAEQDQLRIASTNNTVLPLNFLGQTASGFVAYVPGSGAGDGQPVFEAYTVADANSQSSTFGLLNAYHFYIYPGSFLSDLNWSLGNVPLKEIVMPGTHDSAMYSLNSGRLGFSETQWGDFTHQLAYGARYFDFRNGFFHFNTIPEPGYTDVESIVDPSGDKFSFDTQSTSSYADAYLLYGHGSVLTNYYTIDAINLIEDWLYANPNEVVVLDMNNNTLSGTNANGIPGFAALLQQSHHPDLIYGPRAACNSATCSPSVQPQNMTINSLKQVNAGSGGARLILVNAPGDLVTAEWAWGQVVSGQVGYCTFEVVGVSRGGVASPDLEIQCINNGAADGTPGLQSVRPSNQAADGAPTMAHMVAALTPAGIIDVNSGSDLLAGPLVLADGLTGNSDGFNNGTDPYDLNQQLMNGAWNTNALNMVTIDGLGQDNVAQLLIQRNTQTWVNMHFFNNNLESPAGAISIGANGDTWASAGFGHSLSIFKYNPVTASWAALINGESGVKKLAADPQGGVWVLQSNSTLKHFDKNGQNASTASLTNVLSMAVGLDGSLWVCAGSQGSATCYQYLFADGSYVPIRNVQAGTSIAVDNRGYPLVAQYGGSIIRYNGTSWSPVGAASNVATSQIVASRDGSIFIYDYKNRQMDRYNSQSDSFEPLLMDPTQFAVDPGGQPWAIREYTGFVYKGSLDQM